MKRFILALLLAVILPVSALAEPEMGGYPVAKDEVEARTCYLNSMVEWNRVMATTPLNVNALTHTFTLFSFCAGVAIKTGRPLPNGERVPWLVDYFADTIGALYSQEQLVAATRGNTRCAHVAQANDLAEQALETTGGLDDPSVQQFNYDWATLINRLKTEALSCGHPSEIKV